MHRRSKNKNTPLEVKENESGFTKELEEASLPDLPKGQKVCKATKSKVVKTSKKENLNEGKLVELQKCTLEYSKGLEEELYHKEEDALSCSDALKGGVVGESPLPLNSKENLSTSRPVSSGDECYLTPNKDKVEEKLDCGISEKQRKKPVEFAAVTIAEFGITKESFTKGSIGWSPTLLKFRRRSTIGVRGSPENNALIHYVARQRSKRQKEAFAQVSPFKQKDVRSLKDKIDAFQVSFTSVREAEGETDSFGPSQVKDASQEAGCFDAAQNKVPLTKEQNLEQWSETFKPDSSGADLKENLTPNLASGSKCDTKMCTTLSLHQDVTVTEPAAPVSEEWVYEQHYPTESLEAVLIEDILETGHDFSSDHITEDAGSNVVSDLSKKKVSFVEEVSLEVFDESKPPITSVQKRSISLDERTQSGSHLRSVLKKTPVKQLMDSVKEYSNDAVDREGDESFPVSNSAEILEALQTAEKTGSNSSEKPKKRVTFGEVLSPEIFDENLPANTPLRKGATPVHHPGLQSNSPSARPRLVDLKSLDPLPQPNFDSDDECAEPLQELAEGSVAAEDLLPVENAEAETDKSDTITPCSSTEKCITISEGTDCSISKAADTKDAEETSPRKSKSQRQKNITASAAKKTQKAKRATYGKRRKKKVKKPLYGEREMASKKPLLSPIPEIPEVFSSSSTPNSPKANAFCSGFKDLDALEANNSSDAVFQVSSGDLKSLSSVDHELSDIVPDAKCVFNTSEYFQKGTETACVKEAEESVSLMEDDKLQGNLLDKAEQLTKLEFLEQQDTSVHEGAQGTLCPQEDSVRGIPARKRSSSAIYFPPVEKLEVTGNSLPVSPFNIEEILSAPQLQNDSLGPCKRKSRNSGDKRVRRSMRLHKGAEAEGLAWIQVPSEIQKNPPLTSVGKIRRTISTSILRESENTHHGEQTLIQFLAPGKENIDSFELADGPCKRQRRKSIHLSNPQETRTWSQTRRRSSMTNSVYRKDRNNKKCSEEAEMPLESNSNI